MGEVPREECCYKTVLYHCDYCPFVPVRNCGCRTCYARNNPDADPDDRRPYVQVEPPVTLLIGSRKLALSLHGRPLTASDIEAGQVIIIDTETGEIVRHADTRTIS